MTDKKPLIFAVLLLGSALWLTVSVLITIIGGGSSAAGFGGYFLYNTFYHTAFYVPLYLVFCAVFLLRKKFNKNNIVILILTLVPFFTAGIALRIYLGEANTGFEKIISDSFGPLSPLLLLLLVVIEFILILHASLFLNKQSRDNADQEAEIISDADSISDEDISDTETESSETSYNVDYKAGNLSEYTADNNETENFKTLSLSSVSSLKERPKSAGFNERITESPEIANEKVYSDYSEENPDISIFDPAGNNADPGDFGINIHSDIGDSSDDYQDGYDPNESEPYDSAELSAGGVDYSEPAYFRRQRETEDISAEDENNLPDFDEDDENNISSEYNNIRTADSSDFYEEEFQDIHIADIHNSDNEISILEEAEEKDFNNDSIPVSDENTYAETVDFDEAEDEVFEDEVFEDDDFSYETYTEKTDSLSDENYDPLTQYNTQISTEPAADSTVISVGANAENEESRTVYSVENPAGINAIEAVRSEEYEDPLNNEDEDDFEEEEPVQPDNTAIVKQYFESARFIQAPKKPGKYEIPVENVLDFYQEEAYDKIDARVQEEADVLKRTLAEFKIEAEVTGIRKGPVITMFEILPAPGVKLSRITNLADNIALRLAASRVRIVAPIPGKHAVGIEVPNRKRAIVSFRELIDVNYKQYKNYDLPVVLGKDITGEEQIVDLTKTPHLLIAGATGSGKSVCVNSLITSILYKRAPRDVKMILIDPKIVELKLYNGIPHLLTPVITDAKKAYQALQYCVFEMERRYSLLDALSCRDIKSFNKKIKSEKIATMPMPYIVVVVDEFADLMATTGKELESTLARLAAMSRAVGIHLVLATQRPSIDVITGLIKANIPSRIAFMVASKTDSRIIIDSMGAEMLLGKGDMLFTSAWNPYPVRIQGAFLSENEVERVVDEVKEYGEPEYIDDEIFIDDDEDDYTSFEEEHINDPLMNKALEIVTTAGKASASYLQRRLKIGYNRAARLVEEMERKGIVGPQNGSKPRDLLHIPENFRDYNDREE